MSYTTFIKNLKLARVLLFGALYNSAKNAEPVFAKYLILTIAGTLAFYVINDAIFVTDCDFARFISLLIHLAFLLVYTFLRDKKILLYSLWYVSSIVGVQLLLLILFKNDYANEVLWSVICLVVFLYMCIDDVKVFSVLIFALIGIDYYLGYITRPKNLTIDGVIHEVFLIIYIFLPYVIILKTTNKSRIHNKVRALNKVFNIFANESRTTLRTISSYTIAIKKYLPKLLNTYQIAEKHGLVKDIIYPVHIEILEESFSIIDEELKNLFLMLDMIIMQLTYDPDEKFHPCDAKDCLINAISFYNKNKHFKYLINVDTRENFSFIGNEVLFEHIFFNLFNNAFYQIRSVDKGEIKITLSVGKFRNYIFFTDTSTGINEEILPYIFNEFFSTYSNRIGLGLSYCRNIMKKFQGNIYCESKEGEYTTFKLEFPKIEDL